MSNMHYRSFWDHRTFAVVGHAAAKNFPRLTYRGLKQLGKDVFAVDPSMTEFEGDPVYPDLASLPQPVQCAVLEVPREHTAQWVERAADAGIKDVWIHMGRETPEALALARQRGLDARSGTCAVMYLTPGLTYHGLHKWIMKAAGRY